MRKTFFYLLLVCCFSFASCRIQPISFSGVENTKLGALSQKGVEADITVRIKNPNSLSVTIYKSEFDLFLNGLSVGKAAIAKKVKIKGNTEASYTFKIKSDFSKLTLNELPQLLSIALTKNAKIGLKGEIKGGKFFIKKKFPVEVNQSVPLSGF